MLTLFKLQDEEQVFLCMGIILSRKQRSVNGHVIHGVCVTLCVYVCVLYFHTMYNNKILVIRGILHTLSEADLQEILIVFIFSQ